jgi:hypothetical protein
MSVRFVKLFAVFVFLVFPLSMSVAQTSNPIIDLNNWGEISGILQCNDGYYIEGAMVFIPGQSFVVISDSVGYFLIRNVPEGQYVLKISSQLAEKSLQVGVVRQMVNNLGTINISCNPDAVHCSMAPNGTPCNDNNSCTLNDKCLNGVCAGTPVACNPLPNASVACVDGACAIAGCNPGWGNCDNIVTNGCEHNTINDKQNCGVCGLNCDTVSPANTVMDCVNGKCVVLACQAGYGNCNANNQDGCEAFLANDPNNCGRCGNKCALANAASTCVNGQCTLANCNVGYGNCDTNPANGCEVNIMTDPNNCGGCGQRCNFVNATGGSCVSGQCQVGACLAGYGNCDGNNANGCEVNIMTDRNNCGMCGRACNFANATGRCVNGQCTLATCNAGYGNCDTNPANGCEVNIMTDPNNCGGCGQRCNFANATGRCVNGQCTLATCNAGYGNCDTNPANGCEVNIMTDPNNCGTCGRACNFANAYGGRCASGQCQVGACLAGYGNCDGNDANGCEVNIMTDRNNCGRCGNVCGSGQICVSGICRLSIIP